MLRKAVLFSVLIAAVMLILSTAPLVAGPPDAGGLLRKEQPGQKIPDRLPEPEKKETPAVRDDTSERFTVKGFTFSGFDGQTTEQELLQALAKTMGQDLSGRQVDKIASGMARVLQEKGWHLARTSRPDPDQNITREELQQVVAHVVGQEISFAQLQLEVNKITAMLKARGWLLARAWLPRQDITAGIIHIEIMLGRSDGNLTIKDDDTLRVNKKVLRRIGERGIVKGEVLSRQKLERAALLMNDLPGVKAKLSLQPGLTPGTSSVEITGSEGPLFTGALWGDNYGNRYTGAARANALLNINDPLHLGDHGTFQLTGSEGLYSGAAGYSIPVSANGLRAGIDATWLEYELGKEFSDLDAQGKAFTLTPYIRYPWLRSRKANIFTQLAYDYKALSDSILDIETDDKTLNSLIFTASGDLFDAFNGGGLTTWYASGTWGYMDERTADIDITGVEGGYTLFKAGASRLQRIYGELLLNFAWQSQFSPDNLDSSEQFSLGGPDGVRAYPVSEGLGDQGHLFRLESRYNLPVPEKWGTFCWKVFYDAGYIRLHNDPWPGAVDTATDKNSYWLQGAGTGFDYLYKERFSARIFWAHAIGDNDGKSSDGDNADGQDNNDSFWVQAVWQF